MSIKILRNGLVFDGRNEALIEGGSIVIENDRIREVAAGDVSIAGADVIDMGGRFVMPGLLDLHFHVYSISLNMSLIDNMTLPLKVAYAARLLRGTLHRGYTTVRDPGGGEIGLHLAISQGLMEGPRLYYGGKALSQTGGHGDMRPEHHHDSPCGCAANNTFAEVVDGVENVRKFCRNELRKGADHIKLFISGGVASPTDPIWMPQYTNEEILAAVYEASTRRKYVVAHCHTDDGARRCLETGIRSIDHCTIITQETAQLIAAADGKTYAVPTIAVQEQIMRHGPELGVFGESLEKIKVAHAAAYQSMEYLKRAGARVGMGTDLFEERFHPMQNQEFSFRSDIFTPIELLRSATSINAEIMQKSGLVGSLEPGAYADLIAIDRNPLKDIHVMAQPDEHFSVIMKGGEFVRNRL
ncbi:amidohydrolase family protein [Solimonas sp. SE-A11]|uniref:metal-dependent hydrolase family protein n=1 Tax=Solimonas sp. SE-A11 TaxID=3054954 RepID=UPI00259C8491|nr:amidohydrolase family protein [Solimonas sp. SE-A11]MDM4769860.1 amidohydrolase family protein [Solimonas sp. SE-A11]